MKIFKILLCYVFACGLTFSAQAEEINISLDKNVITEADTVNLTISYSGNSDENPDLSALQNDFQIVSNMASKRMNYINGNFSQIKSWTIGLKPLKQGKITIKPIKIGSVSSNYADIEVKEVTDVAFVPDSQENSNSPYFQIEQSISPTKPYVQQQSIVWVTLYDSLGLQDGSLSISDDTLKNWSIAPISSKPKVTSEFINGKKMNVVKYAFAAFPLKSGKINSPQFIFDGAYIKDVGFNFPKFNDPFMAFGIDFQNSFGQKVPVRMKTKIQPIDVAPVPEGFTGTWLPLSNLTIDAKWSPNTKFQTGEALTRNVTIQAFGLQEEMFPSLSFPNIEGFKQYPEKPEITSSILNGQIVTTAKYNIVYIPSKSGKFTFPAQEIEWFNINSKDFQKTVIPAETISISVNPNIPDKIENALVESQIEPAIKEDHEVENKPLSDSRPINILTEFMSYKVYVLPAIALLFFLFLLSKLFTPKHAGKDYRSAVISSIRKKNYAEARKNLILWATTKFNNPHIQNLNDIAEVVQNADFRVQLNALNQILYSDSPIELNTSEFLAIYKKIDKQNRKSSKNKEILPNLYN